MDNEDAIKILDDMLAIEEIVLTKEKSEYSRIKIDALAMAIEALQGVDK